MGFMTKRKNVKYMIIDRLFRLTCRLMHITNCDWLPSNGG